MPYSRVLGIDACKKRLDCDFFPYQAGAGFALANDEAGVEALLARLRGSDVEAVAVEACGGCERLVVERLRQAGLLVLVLPPARVRAFAKALGRQAKTDPLDARTIAEFAAGYGQARTPRAPAWDKVAELLTYYQQLIEDIARARTCLASLRDPEVRAHADRRIRLQLAEKKALLKRLRELVAEEPALQARVRLLATMPGIGFLNAVNLAVRLPELGAVPNKAIAALGGLAPYPNDSGERTGVRHIRGGRERVRTLLFMGALAAVRANPTVQALYQRLIAKGRAHKCALIAAMRKMLVALNAMVRTNQPWRDITA
jgi:transposase